MLVQDLRHKLVHNERAQVFGMKTMITAAVPFSASPAYTAHMTLSSRVFHVVLL